MSDLWVRALIAAVFVLAALVIAATARDRQRRRAAVAPLDLSGIEGRVVLFTDITCTKCDEARSVLRHRGVEFVEIAYDRDPERFGEVGVEAVPVLVARGPDGGEVGRIAGKVTTRGLVRLLSRMG